MANGNFSFKSWTKSGDKGVKKMWNDQTEAIKSLGISWKTEADELVYRIRLNFSKKKRNKYLGEDTTRETLENDFPKKFTKRMALKLKSR